MAMDTSRERSNAIHLNGVSIFHVDLNGGKSPILMLHGNGEDHSSLLPLGRALARAGVNQGVDGGAAHGEVAGHRVHLIDSRNHGQSSRHADVSYAAMAADVVAFIEHLHATGAESAPLSLVGFSDGAIIAILVALSRPDLVHRLALLGPNLSPDDFTPESRQWIEAEWASTGNPLMQLMLTQPHIPLSDLQRIPHPAWVVAGEDDACPREVFERIAAHLPQGRLSVLAGHNHFSYIFGSDELGPALRAFLREPD